MALDAFSVVILDGCTKTGGIQGTATIRREKSDGRVIAPYCEGPAACLSALGDLPHRLPSEVLGQAGAFAGPPHGSVPIFR